MCGIVGYIGHGDTKSIIMGGLKKLEYRGYDSAGLAMLNNGELKIAKASGKLSVLQSIVDREVWIGSSGIGHTRWATHGEPSDINAHPHRVDDIVIVHNGIIENYQEIKAELLEKGIKIISQTDSELVAHLIALEYKETQNLLKSVIHTLPKLSGAFSIVAISAKNPNEIIGFKDGPPLVVGLGKDENFLASDPHALIQYTNDFIYLNDRDVIQVNRNAIQLFDVQGNKKNHAVTTLNWTAEQAEKQGYASFMLKEVFEQPRVLAAAMAPHISGESIQLKGIGFKNPSNDSLLNNDWAVTQTVLKSIKRIFIIGCGTSYYAGQAGKYFIENLARIPVVLDIASEFRYREALIPKDSLVISISQSGETADTLAAVRLAKEKGALILSICNVQNSSIDRIADGHLYMNAGLEVGVASTKAFTATLTVLGLFSLALGKIQSHLTIDEESTYVRGFLNLPSKMEVALNYDKFFKSAAMDLTKFRGFLFMGRGISYPVAMEGALKLKELAYLHAEGYAAGEMKHGPIALIDESMAVIVIAPHDNYFEKTLSNIEEIKARNGYIIAFGAPGSAALERLADIFIPIPDSDWLTSPVLNVVPLQLLAYHVSTFLGHDVDQPRNLAKSVTVE